jgi:hypothetical protein
MGISITHNDDGSITAECNGEELTFFPKSRTRGGGMTSGPDWNPPISTGGRHRAFVYVPVGDEPETFEPRIFGPTIEFEGNENLFKRELTRALESHSRIRSGAGVPRIRVMAEIGRKLDMGTLMSAADAVMPGDSPIAVLLTKKQL